MIGLYDRIQHNQGGPAAALTHPSLTTTRQKRVVNDSFRELKLAVHNRLLETIDVAKLESLDPLLVSTKLTAAIGAILEEEDRLLTPADRARLVEEIKNEMLGLGSLEPLLWDDEISDILINGHSQVYVEKHGKLQKTDVVFQDDQHLLHIIERIVSRVGRRVDESSPMVDARLPDGSRVNAIIPPLALDGETTDRKHGSVQSQRWNDRVDARAVGESGIHHRG